MWLDSLFASTIVDGFSTMILHSLWQGSIIALLLALILKFVPEENSSLRFNISAFALFSMLVIALITFLSVLEETSYTGSTFLLPEQSGDVIAFDKSFTWTNYGVIIWLVGLIILFIRLLLGYSFIFKLVYSSRDILGLPAKSLALLKSRLNILSKVRLVESAMVTVPMTIGYLKPMILLPLGLATNLTTLQIEAIIAHELAHIKRADYVMNFLYSFIEIVFYYHPAIWWVSTQMQHEREANCDDLAIALTGNKKNYLSTLYSIQKQLSTPKLAMTMVGHSSSMLRRFSRQMNSPTKKSKTMEKFTMCSLVFIALIGLSFKNGNAPKEFLLDIKTEGNIEMIIYQDTIPKNKKTERSKIITKFDGTRYQLETENGEITVFKKDGKTIAPPDYPNYADLIARLRDLPKMTPPTAPTAPTPPLSEEAISQGLPYPPKAPAPAPPPPTPAAPNVDLPASPPAPPAPPSPVFDIPTPPTPPAPPSQLQYKEEMMAKQRVINRIHQEQMALRDHGLGHQQNIAANHEEIVQQQVVQEVEETRKRAEINLILEKEQQRIEKLREQLDNEGRKLERETQVLAQELEKSHLEPKKRKNEVLRNEVLRNE